MRASAVPIEDLSWAVRNKHLAGAVGVFVGGVALLWNETKRLEGKMELKIDALSAEIRGALAAMAASKGAMDAHAEFYRDARGRLAK